MGLVAEYGSDSESDSEGLSAAGPSRPFASTTKPGPSSAPPPVKAPPKKRAAVKIGFDLKPLPDDEEDAAPQHKEGAPRKRPKLGDTGKGKGKSALLDMLPAPKRALPPSKTAPAPTTPAPTPPLLQKDEASEMALALGAPEDDVDDANNAPSFAPRSLGKKAGKATQPVKAPSMDFFGIGTMPGRDVPTGDANFAPRPGEASASAARAIASQPIPPPSSMSITSAPEVKDYVPPPPSINDPYPGYYQLPSGSWAAYDRGYYMSCFKQAEEDGPVGRDWDAMGQVDQGGMQKIDVAKDLQHQKKLEEERKKLTAVEPSYEESKYKVSRKLSLGGLLLTSRHFHFQPMGKTTGKAGQKHQLTALLKDAHMNRRAMEETIAGNKRKQREAGTKYGGSRSLC